MPAKTCLNYSDQRPWPQFLKGWKREKVDHSDSSSTNSALRRVAYVSLHPLRSRKNNAGIINGHSDSCLLFLARDAFGALIQPQNCLWPIKSPPPVYSQPCLRTYLNLLLGAMIASPTMIARKIVNNELQTKVDRTTTTLNCWTSYQSRYSFQRPPFIFTFRHFRTQVPISGPGRQRTLPFARPRFLSSEHLRRCFLNTKRKKLVTGRREWNVISYR